MYRMLKWYKCFSSNYTYTFFFSKLMINNSLTNTVKLNCPKVVSPTPIFPPVYVSLFDIIIDRIVWTWGVNCMWLRSCQCPLFKISEQQWMMTDWHPVMLMHGCRIYTVKTLNMDDLMTVCHTLSWTKQKAAYSTRRQEDGNVFLLFHLRTEHLCCAKSK